MKNPTLMDETLIETVPHSKKELIELDNQTDMLLQAMKERRLAKNEMRSEGADAAIA